MSTLPSSEGCRRLPIRHRRRGRYWANDQHSSILSLSRKTGQAARASAVTVIFCWSDSIFWLPRRAWRSLYPRRALVLFSGSHCITAPQASWNFVALNRHPLLSTKPAPAWQLYVHLHAPRKAHTREPVRARASRERGCLVAAGGASPAVLRANVALRNGALGFTRRARGGPRGHGWIGRACLGEARYAGTR